jgi:UDP-glucose/GDP-mannose dehydrogenase family, UDP binding domain.
LVDSYDGKYDAIIIGVAHNQFKDIGIDEINELSKDKPIVIDLKSILGKDIQKNEDISYWSL